MPKFENDPVVSEGGPKDKAAITGVNAEGPGVHGKSQGTGVWGESATWMAVYGYSKSTTGGAGVMGEGASGPGVIGKSGAWIGVYGETAGIANGPAGVWGEHKAEGCGVKAVSKSGAGLAAYSEGGEAVHAETRSPGPSAAIAAYNLNSSGAGPALFAKKEGEKGLAGHFEGGVFVSKALAVGGDIILSNADCAEDFDVALESCVEPGMVMVVGENDALLPCAEPFDRRVAGVISGAGNYRPGIVLDRHASTRNRQPIALLGKVYCKVDASFAPVLRGDLLTTSSTLGHAMKVVDHSRAAGAVLGKALRPLERGVGLIPILVTLQ